MNLSFEELTRQAGLLMRTHAVLYYAVSKVMTEKKGFEGGRAVRRWVRIQANWRGEEMKKAHTALGMPVDVEHIQRFWDNALSDFWHRKEGKYTTYDVDMQVPSCAYADVWKERNWWIWGHIYCDELHQHILETYNPDGVVVIPQCLMKGDSQCDFRWILPPSARLSFEDVKEDYPGQDHRRDYLADTPEEAQKKNIRRGVRILGMELFMLKKTLQEAFEEEAESLYGEIMKLTAQERGKDFVRHFEASGKKPLTFSISDFDIPLCVFEPEIVEEKEKITVRFTDNPLFEGLSYFGMGKEAHRFMRDQSTEMSDACGMPVKLSYIEISEETGELIFEKG